MANAGCYCCGADQIYDDGLCEGCWLDWQRMVEAKAREDGFTDLGLATVTPWGETVALPDEGDLR